MPIKCPQYQSHWLGAADLIPLSSSLFWVLLFRNPKIRQNIHLCSLPKHRDGCNSLEIIYGFSQQEIYNSVVQN